MLAARKRVYLPRPLGREELLKELFARFGCEILVVNRTEDASPAQELAEDLIKHCPAFCGKA